MITKDMKVCDILSINEDYEGIFEKHGLLCNGCPGAFQESLEEAADGHGISIDALLKDLNAEEAE
jgi:hydrid cluster protein-associated redox disulfide domain